VNEQLKELSGWINKRMEEWVTGNFEAMLATYNKRLYKNGKEVKFKNNNISFTGTVLGVNALGQLIINHGIEQAYNFGEIIWEQESINK
jgi:biotin-(acetyl-CoA carboxylase) ligase